MHEYFIQSYRIFTDMALHKDTKFTEAKNAEV